MEFSTFYTELDCILDTRLAVIYGYGEDVTKIALTEVYFNRPEDKFNGIDYIDFKLRYQDRTKNILKNSLYTPIIQLMQEFVQKTIEQTLLTPFHKQPKIVVNTYPYKFNDNEANALASAIITLTNKDADVQIVFLTLEDLTPKFVKMNYSIMVMYEYTRWLEYHSLNDNFKKVTCPEVTLFGPMIYFNGLPSSADLAKAKEHQTTPFNAMESTAAPIINLKLLPIELFSIALKLKVKND